MAQHASAGIELLCITVSVVLPRQYEEKRSRIPFVEASVASNGEQCMRRLFQEQAQTARYSESF